MRNEIRETHTSTLLLMDTHVYKRKKPLDLGFSDFRELTSRREACEEEVRLNRRLSPDVYEGVATVLGPDGAPCESLVVMRRLPSERSLTALVSSGSDVREALDAVAGQLVRLHADNPLPPDRQELLAPDQLHRLWKEAVSELEAAPGVPRHLVSQLDQLAHDWLHDHAALIEERRSRGVDGHGDLLADDVFVLEDGPRLLDCLEFDRDLRAIDGLHDACSLAMDLVRLGAVDEAWFFLDRYQRLANDDAPMALAHFYMAYRAIVRAKVAALRVAQGDDDAQTELLLYAVVSRSQLEQAMSHLLLVGGLPGTGKSTLTSDLATSPGWQRISSDELRRRAVSNYTEEGRTSVYTAMLEQASQALSEGRDVVLDATFSSARWRRAARDVAQQHHAHVSEVLCMLPRDVAQQRLALRTGDSSEADTTVYDYLAARWEPWPEARVVDCTDEQQAVREVRSALAHAE